MKDEGYKIDFAKKKGITDEWYTPKSAVKALIGKIPTCKIIWCPFDTEESEFVKVLQEIGYIVEYSHINEGKDFFKYEPEKWDVMISNPPYSIRNEILIRAFSFNKPFALLMNINGLLDSKVRYDLFKNGNMTINYLKGRVNYLKEHGVQQKSSPPFQSAYVCNLFSYKQIMFQ